MWKTQNPQIEKYHNNISIVFQHLYIQRCLRFIIISISLKKMRKNQNSSIEPNEDFLGEEMVEDSESEVFKPRINKRKNQDIIQGTWGAEESAKYIAFMEYKFDIFYSKVKRKQTRIFRSLAMFLQNRNPAQCRSHFQKLSRHRKKIQSILKQEKRHISPQLYEQSMREVMEFFKENQNLPKSDKQKPSVCEKQSVEKGISTISENSCQMAAQLSNFQAILPQNSIDPMLISLYWSLSFYNQNQLLTNFLNPNLPSA